MFAHSGGGGSDDPYNFDIADGFGGGVSKRNSTRSKLGKSSLHKTPVVSVGASSALTPQDSSRATTKLGAAVDLKEPLRASAPAAPTSALDKAMSFLKKYSSNASPNKSTAERTFQKSSDALISTFNEEELDLSLSSGSDAGEWKPARKAHTDWRASRGKLTLEPQEAAKSRALTGMRTSARFSTAKELGISGPEELGVPKAAVSPLGLMKSSTNRSSDGAQQANEYSPPESRLSGLRLAVNIPGESSPHPSLIRPRSSSEVDSIRSPPGEAVEDKTPEEAEGFESRPRHESPVSELASSAEIASGRSSSLASPTFQQHDESTRASKQESRGASDRGLTRSSVNCGPLGNIASFDNLDTVSCRENSPNFDGDTANASDNQLRGKFSSVGNNGSYAAQCVDGEEEDDDDDYGDDDFEDQEVLMESNGEEPDGEQALSETTRGKGSAETAGSRCLKKAVSQPAVPVNGGSPASLTQATAATLSDDKKQREAAGFAVESRAGKQEIPAGATGRIEGRETPRGHREAWSVTATNKEKTMLATVTVDSGTGPESRMDPSADWTGSDSPGNSPSIPGQAPSTRKEAWGDGSSAGSSMKGQRSDPSVVKGPADEWCAAQTRLPNAARCRPQASDAACWAAKQGESIGSVSKRGILMDRSTEARNWTRPDGAEVKVVARAKAVSSVEYAHDPERKLDLRSCGTQMVGNSAAVQANIAVPGMAGTTSHVNASSAFVPRDTRTAGVGYGQGEAYAKWGRFACEVPYYPRGRLSAGHSSLDQPRRHPRSTKGAEPDDHVGRENDGPVIGGSSGAREEKSTGKIEGTGAAQLHQIVGESDTAKMADTPPARGESTYFETFSNVMAKSQEDTCYPWQQMRGEGASPLRESAPSGGCDHSEGETETSRVAEDTQPGTQGMARVQMRACYGGGSEVEFALHDIMAATQDSFRTQLADLRESLNKIRYRAEIGGRRGHTHHYESLADARNFLVRARPRATSPAQALRTIDPSLSVKEAEALAEGGTVPPSPVEFPFSCARESLDGIDESQEFANLTEDKEGYSKM